MRYLNRECAHIYSVSLSQNKALSSPYPSSVNTPRHQLVCARLLSVTLPFCLSFPVSHDPNHPGLVYISLFYSSLRRPHLQLCYFKKTQGETTPPPSESLPSLSRAPDVRVSPFSAPGNIRAPLTVSGAEMCCVLLE